MPAPDPHARPRQVTMAGWVTIIGSVLVVLSVFAQVSTLQSLDTRRSIEQLLSEPPADGLGLEVDTALSLIRVLAMVTGACAAATAILGWQVMQRSRAARLVLSVLAVPLFLAGFVTGGFTSSLVAAAAVVLWLQPARAWVNGDPVPERYLPRPAAQPAQPGPTAPPAGTWPPPVPGPEGTGGAGAPGPTGPSPYDGFGRVPATPADQGAPGASTSPVHPGWPAPQVPQVGHQVGPQVGHAAHRGPVPQQLRIGLVLTWVTSALVVLGLSLTIAAIALDPSLVDESIERAIAENPAMAGEVTVDQVRVGLYAVLAAFVGWAIAAACLAAFAWSGRSWAWVVLCVSAGLAALLLFLVTVLGGLVAAIPLAATAGSLALMLRPEVRAWYAAR